MPHSFLSRRASAPALLAALWFLLNLWMYAGEFRGTLLAAGWPADPPLRFLLALPFAAAFTAAAATAFVLASRVPLGQRPLLHGFLVHAAAAAATVLLVHLVRVGFRLAVFRAGPGLAPAADGEVAESVLLVYLVLTMLGHARAYARRSREKGLQSVRLQASLVRAELSRAAAQLRALKLQLDPSFLQRCLRDAAAFAATDPARAKALVVRLGDLLRRTIEQSAVREVYLEEEAEGLRRFLEVEELRQPGLRVEWACDEEAMDAVVPHLVLQPLVEHAIQRGPAEAIRVGAVRTGDVLRLAVTTDYAPGTAAPPGDEEDGRIAALRVRLAGLYGEAPRVTVRRRPETLVLEVELPWSEVPVPDPAAHAPLPVAPAEADAPGAASAPVTWSRGWAWMGWALTAAWTAMIWSSGYAGRSGTMVHGRAVPEALIIACAGLSALLWAVVPVLAFRLARRAPFSSRTWTRAMLPHAAGALFCGALVVAGKVACRAAMGFPPAELIPPEPHLQTLLVALVFAMFGGMAHAWVYRVRYRERELAGLRLQTAVASAELERTTAELDMLKLQLNPHFLFNSLNAVTTLISRAPAQAAWVLERLDELLARATTRLGVQELPLDEEIEGLRPFLEIERVRHPGLHVVWDVDPSVRTTPVPHMMLQPLVENALKHGLAARGGSGTLRIAAWPKQGWTLVQVEDDGVGLAAAAAHPRPGTGVGLGNVRARLGQMYGDGARLEIAPADTGGTRVTVALRARAAVEERVRRLVPAGGAA